jgi:hypothetical protein
MKYLLYQLARDNKLRTAAVFVPNHNTKLMCFFFKYMEIGDDTSHSIIETIYACHTQQNGVQTSTSKMNFSQMKMPAESGSEQLT